MLAPAYDTEPPLPSGGGAELTPEKLAVAMKAFFRVMDAWGVSVDDARVLLGRPSRATCYNWKRGEVRTVPYDTVRRISYVLGIFKALQILFKEPARADAWVRKQSAAFGGQSALERMLAGDVTDLAAVRRYLDAVRGG